MTGRQRARHQLACRVRLGQLGEVHRTHRRIAEDDLAFRGEQRDGIFEVLHHRLVIGAGARPKRPLFVLVSSTAAQRRELRAHGVERTAEVLELLLRQVEPHVQLAPSQAAQAALNDVNGPQQPLREQHRYQRGDEQCGHDDGDRPAERSPQLAPHQQRRHADANRAELLVVGEQRLAHFITLIGAENRPQACERPGRDQFLEVGLLLDRRALARRKRVGHGDAGRIGDRRVVDVVGRADAGVEDGANAAVGLQGHVGVVRVLPHDLKRALEQRTRHQLGPRRRFLQEEPGHRAQVIGAQDRHDDDDQRGDAGDLFGFDAHAWVCAGAPPPAPASARIARAADSRQSGCIRAGDCAWTTPRSFGELAMA